MSDLSDLIQPEAVLAGVSAVSKKGLFTVLGATAARQLSCDAALVVERLTQREKLGSTGFGGGIAIPHARIDGVERVTGVFARLAKPVEFKAIDELPVDLVFMLASPMGAGGEHLKALARVSRQMRDRSFAAKLRGAGSTDAIYALLTGIEERDAA